MAVVVDVFDFDCVAVVVVVVVVDVVKAVPADSDRVKRAGTSLCTCLHTRHIAQKGRSIFRRSTENGPAFP